MIGKFKTCALGISNSGDDRSMNVAVVGHPQMSLVDGRDCDLAGIGRLVENQTLRRDDHLSDSF